jgi:hypothetical protein
MPDSRSAAARGTAFAGAGLAASAFAIGLLVFLSSASKRNGMTAVQKITAESRRNFLLLHLDARISLSQRVLMPWQRLLMDQIASLAGAECWFVASEY